MGSFKVTKLEDLAGKWVGTVLRQSSTVLGNRVSLGRG